MLRSLLEYNIHSNDLYIHFIEKEGITEEKSHSLLSHIINAQLIWNARIKLGEVPVAVWQMHNVHELKHYNAVAYEESLDIMVDMHPTSIISYQNSKGQHFQNSAHDIMYHVVNHATYHRGQIAARLKDMGFQAPISDYIFYKREL